MPPSQEVSNTDCHMVIDGSVRRHPGPVAEVIQPTPQDAVQLLAHFRPRFGMARHQHLVHLLSQSRYTFLRRTCSQVPLIFFASLPEVRVLPSTGVTRLPQYRDPLRVPTGPPSLSRPWERFSTRLGVPPFAQTGSPSLPCPLPRWTPTGARVGCFPAGAAFPVSQAGRRPRLHFPVLLRLHSRYGRQSCSAPLGGLCHKAPTWPLPVQAACQLPDLPTTIGVGLPPTSDLRLWGALRNPG
jgi:hypothetical protein